VPGRPDHRLCVERAALGRFMEAMGPDNEQIRDRLVEWAARATSFRFLGEVATPLDQVGAAKADDDLVHWQDTGFYYWLLRELGISERAAEEFVAESLGMSLEQLDDLDQDEFEERARGGLQVAVADKCPPTDTTARSLPSDQI
jgi:hypothetical protein